MSENDRSDLGSHVRVFVERNSERLDKMINEEITAGDYVVSGVSITDSPTGLIALVAFEPPARSK